MKDSITRSIEIQEVAKEAREFVGIVAPYDEVITVGGYKERYERGVFADAPNVQIYWNHDIKGQGGSTPIGRVSEFRETDKGLEVVAKIASTARGDEVLTLLREGVLDSLSANFYPTKSRQEEDVTVYERAELLEVSVVGRSAYPSAKISEVRNDSGLNKYKGETLEKIMEITYDDSELRSEVEDLKRRFEVNENREDEKPAVSKFRSFGDYVQAYVENDEEAHSLMRAYTGGTTADSVIANGWTSDIIKIVNAGRPVLNAFSKGQWVQEGNNIEYAKLDANTVSVDSQVNEGDDLAFGKVSVTSAYTPKLTRGGYTEMSLQEIKRSNVNILSVAFEAMAAEYARATEADVRAALAGASAHTVTNSLATADDWVSFVIDAAVWLDTKGLTPEFMVVSVDNFKELALLDKADAYVLNRNSGSIDVTGIGGNVLSLPVVVIPGTGVATVAHSSAIKTFESPGAPFQLQDENILNLTKQFSVYGELAVAVQDANALVEAA